MPCNTYRCIMVNANQVLKTALSITVSGDSFLSSRKIRPLLSVSYDTVLKMLFHKPDKPSFAEIYGIIAMENREIEGLHIYLWIQANIGQHFFVVFHQRIPRTWAQVMHVF